MNLPRRRWAALLLWLALALLPLRGWAEVVMPIMMALGGGAAGMQSAAPAGAAMLPCHAGADSGNAVDVMAVDVTALEVAAIEIDSAAPAATDSAAPEHNACSLCDLCHGTVADAPRAPLLADAPVAAKPLPAAPTQVEPAVLSGPERPPRPATL